MSDAIIKNQQSFLPLLSWELQQAYRRPLLWLAIAISVTAILWGALTTANFHAAQSTDIHNAQVYEHNWYAEINKRAADYADDGRPNLPYWQDPTDIAGFSRYFLKKNTFKPHLTLSPLAVGISDLAPSRLPIHLETQFGIEPVYDFINPLSLTLGKFDTAFVVTYLVPLMILLLCGLLGTAERDNGALRFIASQPIAPRYWLGARILSLAIYVVPLISFALLAAILFAKVNIAQAIPQLLTAVVALQLYSLLWFSVAFFLLSFWPHAGGAIGSMIAVWAGLLIGLPVSINAITTLYLTSMTPITYVNESRRINDIVQSQQKEILEKAFANNPALKDVSYKISALDYATKQTFLVPELERQMQPLHETFKNDHEHRNKISGATELFAPGLAISKALAVIAGTDGQRQRLFELQTRAYQQQLRSMFYPLVQQQINSPTDRRVGSSGRFNFTDYEKIPVFTFQEVPTSKQLRAVLPSFLSLAAFTLILVLLTYRRLRHWPHDL